MASRTTVAGDSPNASGAVPPDASGANGLGLVGLTAMVVTTCVGAGIFSLAGNLAQGGANTAAVLVSWVICFVGVLALAKTFSGLAAVRPDLTGGIYAYAAEFGDYVGFLVFVLMRRRQGKSLFPEAADVMFALFVVAAIVSTVALALTGGLSL